MRKGAGVFYQQLITCDDCDGDVRRDKFDSGGGVIWSNLLNAFFGNAMVIALVGLVDDVVEYVFDRGPAPRSRGLKTRLELIR
jgi:hypothetical protein